MVIDRRHDKKKKKKKKEGNELRVLRREAAAEAPLDERGAFGVDRRYGDFNRDARCRGR